MKISLKAGELVGKLYDWILKQYKNPDSPNTLKSLNMLGKIPDDTDDILSTKEIPSWKRICICILKNDHTCKSMGFSETKKGTISPVYNIRAVPVEKVVPNTYNPNSVAPPELKLLYDSIKEDGYTMPVVCYYSQKDDLCNC